MPLPARQQVGSYPQGVDQIPYASYMRITKYTYQEGLQQVGKNQKDALGILGGNSLFAGFVEEIGNKAHNLFNSNVSQTVLTQKTPPQGFNPYSNTNPSAAFGSPYLGLPGGLDPYTQKKVIIARRNRKTRQAAANSNPQSVVLAMPNEFQYEYGANWNNTFKLGTLAMLADNPGKAGEIALLAATLGGVLGAAVSVANPNNTAAGAAQGAGAAVRAAADPFNLTQLNATNLVGLAGLAPNENAIQFFKNMDFRSFTLNFELASRNSTESGIVDFMINYFKVGMHPKSYQTTGTGGVLGFPDVFVLEPMFNEIGNTGSVKPVNHPQMPKTKLCGLTNLKINTTPFNTLTTVFDGTIPLVTMQLTFTELTALTSEDFQTGGGGY